MTAKNPLNIQKKCASIAFETKRGGKWPGMGRHWRIHYKLKKIINGSDSHVQKDNKGADKKGFEG